MLNWIIWNKTVLTLTLCIGQSAGVVEYTDCTSAEGPDPPPNECPGYDTKQSNGEVPVMLGFGGIWGNPSLPLFPGVVALDRALSMG